MPNELRDGIEGRDLDELHRSAEAKVQSFRCARPEGTEFVGKGLAKLGRGEIIRSVVQIVKKDGGENNLHYHTHVETLWWVIRGTVRFYGPNDVVLGEFGPNQGVITPRYARYWFKSVGDDDLELLQVAASDSANHLSGRTPIAPPRADFRLTVLSEEKPSAATGG